MTDQPEQPPLDPAEEARVRRLLADARATGPVPEDVAARMERTIARLQQDRATGTAGGAAAAAAAAGDPVHGSGGERDGDGHGGDVVPLSSRLRRRSAAALLAGAAAVVLVGLGIGQVVDSDGAGDAGTAADSAVERGDAAALEDSEPLAEETAARVPVSPSEAEDRPNLSAQETMSTDEPPRTVRPRRLVADLTSLQRVALPHPATADYAGTAITAPEDFPCAPAPWGRGIVVGVLYEGAPAMVAFRQPMGESQVAEVLQCGTGAVLRSTTLPASD